MSETVVRGFILQPTYQLRAGRPVVHLWGKLEDGRSFLLRDRRTVPHFFVAAADAERARELGAAPLAATDRRALGGGPVVRVELQRPSDTPALRDRLQNAGIPCYEADVRFAMRFLIDRGIRGTLAIGGEGRPGRTPAGPALVFDDPDVELDASPWTPRLSVLSFDIETDPDGERLLSLAVHGAGAAEVLLLRPPGTPDVPGARSCASEAELLRVFAARVRALDPDVLTGWNVGDFDFPVLLRRAQQVGAALDLGRAPGMPRLEIARFGRGATRVIVPGRVVLDGLALLRGAFVRLEEYSLDAVAREILGEGKTMRGPGRAEEILHAFHHDPRALAEYNLADARLALGIVEKLQLVELAVERSRLTGLPPDRVSSSVAAFDFLYLSGLGKRRLVAPTVGGGPPAAAEERPEMTGGHVLEPLPGLYRNVLLFDFQSLYPSLIRTFQIDPAGLVEPPDEDADSIVAPNGAAFRRAPGILPGLLDELVPRRQAAERAGDRITSYAIKILMNSFYGVLGTPACRFFDPRVANAITSFGREILLWTKARVEQEGLRVLYGDTDSLFVASGEEDPDAARRRGAALAVTLERALAEHVRARWRVESRLRLEFETLYLRLLLPTVRHGSGGARKRYAGLVEEKEEGGERRVVFTGMEVVRRDSTELARRVQQELYRRLFADEPLAEYLRQVVADVRAGAHDDLLVYHKGLRKDLADYTATTPPHVVAARKLAGGARWRIAYVMTANGPEPESGRSSPLDYEHYVAKQVRPVAEPVLAILGLDFDEVIGDARQLPLF